MEFQEITRPHPAPRVLLVDLAAVPSIVSAALGNFVGPHISCEGRSRKYGLIGANGRLKTLFDLTRVKSFLNAYHSLATPSYTLE